MIERELIKALLPPAAFAVGGGIVGLILQFLMFPSGGRRAGASPARPGSWLGDVLTAVLRGPTVLWCAAAGLFLALEVLDISGRVALGVRHTLFVLVVLSISWSVARLVGAIVGHLSRPLRGTLASATLLVNVARLLVLMLGILIILQTFGVSITPALTALGIGGLAIGLALQDTLANFFAGIHILSSRQVRPGDYVQLATGEEGYIQDVTWRYTTIRQLSNNLTIVPNAKLAGTTLTNYYLPAMEMAVLVPVTVANDTDLARVETISLDVAQAVMDQIAGGVNGFKPFVRFSSFSKPGVAFTVVLRGRELTDQHLIQHEFIKQLHARFRTEDIHLL
jgi:small-conductance mechanosensitive channel